MPSVPKDPGGWPTSLPGGISIQSEAAPPLRFLQGWECGCAAGLSRSCFFRVGRIVSREPPLRSRLRNLRATPETDCAAGPCPGSDGRVPHTSRTLRCVGGAYGLRSSIEGRINIQWANGQPTYPSSSDCGLAPSLFCRHPHIRNRRECVGHPAP